MSDYYDMGMIAATVSNYGLRCAFVGVLDLSMFRRQR